MESREDRSQAATKLGPAWSRRGILTQGKGEWVRDFWRSTPPLWTFAILDIGKPPWPPPPGPLEREPPATECAEAPLKLTWNLKASDPWAVPYQLPPLHKGRRPGTFMCPQDTTLMAGKQLGQWLTCKTTVLKAEKQPISTTELWTGLVPLK